MRHALTRHLDSRSAVTGITVEVSRRGGVLALRYVLTGATAELTLPSPAVPARTDELWRHTCFEAFVRPGPGEAYYEFNFAPSTQWAAYRFDRRREGMAPADIFPEIAVATTEDGVELTASLTLPDDGPWRLGLSAVIEAADGSVSYWALAHPPVKPDFHHPDCFALEIAATGPA